MITINWIKGWLNNLYLHSFNKTTLPYSKDISSLSRPRTCKTSRGITNRLSPYTRYNWTDNKPITKEISRNRICLSYLHYMSSISSLKPSLRVPSKIASVERRSTTIPHTAIKERFATKWRPTIEGRTSWHQKYNY